MSAPRFYRRSCTVNEMRYNKIKMEYPELGWNQIQALRERLGTDDRKLVEGLLDKIESLYWDLERARITPTSIPDPSFHVASIPHDGLSLPFNAAHMCCSCLSCAPEKYQIK